MSVTTTKTTNRLHFSDLDPMRFEDLCLALIFPLHPWIDIRHYGRSGTDGGVDIFAHEKVEDGKDRFWIIQCKRYKKASKSILEKTIREALGLVDSPPEVLLIIVACDISRAAHEAYIDYATSKGIDTPLLWTASVLEARLHAERRDLLFSYFGISDAAEARYREATITRNIAIKKRLYRELRKNHKDMDRKEIQKDPSKKFKISEAIVHSIDDTTYPEIDAEGTGISGWFKLEIWDFYHNGLEFVARVEYAVIDNEGKWSLIDYDKEFDQERYQKIKLFRLLRIPFRNIVNFDTIGDEYYPQPHIYCRFADGGEPYEGSRYVLVSDDYPWPMDTKLRFEINEKTV